jgi:hypothetical protein
MVVHRLEVHELREAAEEWRVLANTAEQAGRFHHADRCRENAILYENMAESLEELRDKKLNKPVVFRAVSGDRKTNG